jgi:hypothetical protein
MGCRVAQDGSGPWPRIVPDMGEDKQTHGHLPEHIQAYLQRAENGPVRALDIQ